MKLTASLRAKAAKFRKARHAWNETKFVAVLIDLDNLMIDLKYNGADFSPAHVQEIAQRYGTVIVARMFCDFHTVDRKLASRAHISGFDQVNCPKLPTEGRKLKDTVDEIFQTKHIPEILERYPEVETYMIATVDRNFAPAVNLLKQRGKHVVLLYGGNKSHLTAEAGCETVSVIPAVTSAVHAIKENSWSLRSGSDLEIIGARYPEFIEFVSEVVVTARKLLIEGPKEFRTIRSYTWSKNDNISSFVSSREEYTIILSFLSDEGVFRLVDKIKTRDQYDLDPAHPLVEKNI